jgi:hypothetical protein
MRGYGIVGQVINVPVDVNNMVTTLQRQLERDYSHNVHLLRNVIHKNTYLQRSIKKATVKRWLEYLMLINRSEILLLLQCTFSAAPSLCNTATRFY